MASVNGVLTAEINRNCSVLCIGIESAAARSVEGIFSTIWFSEAKLLVFFKTETISLWVDSGDKAMNIFSISLRRRVLGISGTDFPWFSRIIFASLTRKAD